MKLKSGGLLLRLVWPEFGIVKQNKTFLLIDIQRWMKFRFLRSHPVWLQKETYAYTFLCSHSRGCPKWGPAFYLLLFSLPIYGLHDRQPGILGIPQTCLCFPISALLMFLLYLLLFSHQPLHSVAPNNKD